MNYVGNLIFRIAHNFVFHPLSPRGRVFVSLFSMIISMSILILCCLGNANRDWVALIYVAYFLGGMSVGTYESNMVTCVTPLVSILSFSIDIYTCILLCRRHHLPPPIHL